MYRRLKNSQFFVVLAFVVVVVVAADRANSPEDDSYYVNPNTYITSNGQNQHVQDVLRKYSQEPRYPNNPLPINRDLLDKLSSTPPPDPRYDNSQNYPQQNFRSGRPYSDGRNTDSVDRYRYQNQNYGTNGDRNRHRYDVYPESNRGEPPRQYFENDPQYSLREDEILKILAQIDMSASQQCNINVRAQWDFETNVNDVNQIRAVSCSKSIFLKLIRN